MENNRIDILLGFIMFVGGIMMVVAVIFMR